MASTSAYSSKSELSVAQESSIDDAYLAPEARFECPICLAWLRDPLLTSCGHRFCRKCIESWLQRENPCCPVDNMKLTKDDIFPDNFTRREINQQRTKCPNIVRGCLEQLNPLDVESHLLVCEFRPPELPDNEKLRCFYVNWGCEEKFEDEPELEKHLEQKIHKHLNMISDACRKLTISQASGSSVIAQEANFWDPPSKNDQPSMSDSGNINELLKALYEKIVILEQKTREQDIIIANMTEQIQSTTLSMSKISLRHCNGCYLWYFKDFKSKISIMRNDHRNMYYSPGFYTSPNGYKLCIRLNISPYNQNSIAILIHMMKSEHDNTLDWPFSGRLTITLIHPVDASKNIKETMMTRPALDAFQKPVQEMNPKGFGYTEFALIEELFSQGYIDNNHLVVKSTSPSSLVAKQTYFRLCIRLNISPYNQNSIAILIHMMKSEHDNTLDWPFSGRLTITLIHPVDASKNIKETMMTRPALDAFQKPVQEMNPKGFGYTEFALIEELFSQGYIDNNHLVVKVQAHPVL